ncbi:hypothetical protein RMSM_03352 [Rhodopirellula maiorica SM1]|uniref:Uncharacterized protein n=1 Tax=Rhodopirellula maiorica SM1 TaxID=1265738 RepID=M5RWA7_9BACT|nr:hypothetical protein RMSM_03352 [Rhodopirellula maiorica SM1]
MLKKTRNHEKGTRHENKNRSPDVIPGERLKSAETVRRFTVKPIRHSDGRAITNRATAA